MVPAHLILWPGKTGSLYLASDIHQELLHIGTDTGKTCRGCVSVGGRNNFRMAGASRMPAGSRRCLKGSAHPWPVGAGVRDCCRAGLQQCPTMFP